MKTLYTTWFPLMTRLMIVFSVLGLLILIILLELPTEAKPQQSGIQWTTKYANGRQYTIFYVTENGKITEMSAVEVTSKR